MTIDRNVLPGVGPAPAFRLPEIRRDTLSTGARLLTVDHRGTALVSLLVLIPRGSAADPPGREGLAGLTADLLDDGSAGRSGIELHEALDRIGGHLGTEVTSDATILSITALARHAREAMALLVEIATAPRFHASEVERVRALRVNRIAQMRHAAGAVADRAYLQALYGAHPYGHPAIGTELTLPQIGADDVRAFHAAHYMPRHWTVIAAGNVGAGGLREIAGDVVDAIPDADVRSSARGPRTAPADPPPPSDRLVFVPRDGAVQSEIRIGHVGVARRTDDYHALMVLNMVLGGQFVSRLNLNLREDKGYTYGVRTAFDCRLGRGPFTLQASVDTAATADAITEAVREVREIRDARPVTDAELRVARAALTNGFPRNFETAGHVARAAMHVALFDLPDDEFARFVPRVTAVDVDAATAAASRHLDPDGLVAVVVGSPDDVRPSLRTLGFGEPVER